MKHVLFAPVIVAPVIAVSLDAVIWILVLIGWVALQAMLKNTRRRNGGNAQPERSPLSDLDDLLEQAMKPASESSETEKPTPSADTELDTPPVQPVRLPKPAPCSVASQARKPRKQDPIVALHAQPVPEQATRAPAEPAAEPGTAAVAASFLKSLNNPRAWRQAIVLHEVMGPPKSLRGPAESSLPGIARP